MQLVKTGLSFIAKDANNKSYRIVEWVEVEINPIYGGTAVSEGNKYLKSQSGEGIKYLSKGHYEFDRSGIELRSDDPNAP